MPQLSIAKSEPLPDNGLSIVSSQPLDRGFIRETAAQIRGTAPDQPAEQQGFFRSIYETAIRPAIEQVHDAFVKGDLGASAAEDTLRSIFHEASQYAQSINSANPVGDIRKLPFIGSGIARAEDQAAAGNYKGAAGSIVGTAAPFVAPEVIRAGRAGIEAAPDAIEAARKLGSATTAGVKAAAPDVAAGAAKAAAGVAIGKTLGHEASVVMGVPVYKGGAQIGEGLRKGFQAARDDFSGTSRLSPGDAILKSMRDSIAEAERAAAERAAAPAYEPGDVIDERPDAREVLAQTPAAEPDQAGSTYVAPTPRMWPAAAAPSTAFQRFAQAVEEGNKGKIEFYSRKVEAEQSQPAHEVPTASPNDPKGYWPEGTYWRRIGEPVPADAPADAPARTPIWRNLPDRTTPADPAPAETAPARLPSGRVPGNGQPVEIPAVVEDLARKGLLKVAPAEETPAAERTPSPGIDRATQLEDAADAQAARMKMDGESIEWANRARKADRFAAFLLQNKLEPTTENLARATKELAEDKVPSAETVDMIHDRMGYTAPETAAAPEASAADAELERQLQASIEAAQAKRAAAQQSAIEAPLQQRLSETLAPAKPGSLAQLDPKTISVDPVRFQFKRDTGGASGTSAKLKTIEKYDPELGGILSVWTDPADGRTYVVNGHHRLELAQRTGAPSVDVRYIDAQTAQEARAKGALINIAEDQGTPIDAAKVFRDTGMTPEKLKARNISLDGRVARAGLGLSNLDQSLFDGVVRGDIPQETGATIGELLAGRFADQRAVMDAVNKAAARGKQMTPAQIAESIRVGLRPENEIKSVQDTLFGSVEDTRSLFSEIGEISDYVRKQLGAEKRTFGTVSKSAAAGQLERAGNKLNPDENLRIAAEAKHAQAVYDKLSGMSGAVADAIARGARQLAEKGSDANAVKQATYESVRRAISQTLPR